MKLIFVNVGRPCEVSWLGQKVATGIFKEPVARPVRLRRLNLDGDQHADLTVHGPDKALTSGGFLEKRARLEYKKGLRLACYSNREPAPEGSLRRSSCPP